MNGCDFKNNIILCVFSDTNFLLFGVYSTSLEFCKPYRWMIERTRNLSSSENSIPSGQTVEVNLCERIAAREYWVG